MPNAYDGAFKNHPQLKKKFDTWKAAERVFYEQWDKVMEACEHDYEVFRGYGVTDHLCKKCGYLK